MRRDFTGLERAIDVPHAIRATTAFRMMLVMLRNAEE